MARIPEQDIERLKQEVSIKSLVENRGVGLKKHGADWIGLCPFHPDKEPSLVVSPQKGLWHCLGACRTGGSVIDWVMKAEGVSFRHAVELLREGHASTNASDTSPKPPVTKCTTNKIPIPFDKEVQDKEGDRLLPRDLEAKPGSLGLP